MNRDVDWTVAWIALGLLALALLLSGCGGGGDFEDGTKDVLPPHCDARPEACT